MLTEHACNSHLHLLSVTVDLFVHSNTYLIQTCCNVKCVCYVETSVCVYVYQTDSYSLSQAEYLSIRFRAEGLVCAKTSRKSAVVTVSSWTAGMSISPVEENHEVRLKCLNQGDRRYTVDVCVCVCLTILMCLQSIKDLTDWSHGGLFTHQSDVRSRVTLHLLKQDNK